MAKTLEAHDKLIREATELFDDLYSAMQDARAAGASSQYFLGSIVLIKADRDPKSFVVDGQQRLSTLTILLAVLRVLMPNSASFLTKYLYKEGNPEWGELNEYRLKAREEDADFFRTYIQEQGGLERLVSSTDKLKDSRLRYRENATLLLEKAKSLSPADLNALWKFLANDCSLVVISTPDLEAAYRIFAVLNNRGLDLAPIDIIKAQVLGLIRTTAGEVKSRAYAKEWSRIESSLGRDAFGDLFGHIRSIYAKKKQKYISTSSTRSSNPMPKCGTSCAMQTSRPPNTPRRSTNTCLGSTAWTSRTGCPRHWSTSSVSGSNPNCSQSFSSHWNA